MRAILYSGDLRTYEFCVKNHREVFGPCDVYFSLWDKFNYKDRMNDEWHSRLLGRRADPVTADLVERKTPPGFSIKGLEIGQYWPDALNAMKQNSYLIYQYHRIKTAFDMMQQEYDEVVRMRCDIEITGVKFSDKLTCNKYIWVHKKHTLFTPEMNEMIFTGNYETMRKACSIIDNIPEINKTLPKEKLYGESVFYHHLKMENIKYRLFDFGFKVMR